MKNHAKKYLIILMVGLMSLSGCAYSRVVTSWKDDTLQRGQLKKTMVLAVVEKDIIRKRLEDEFVLRLRKMGADAVQSYKSFPNLKGIDKARVKDHLVETGMDSVLVSRLIDTQKETVVVPATSTTMGGYYSSSYSTVYSPEYAYDFKVFTLQNNLFAVKDEKLVWTAVTQTEEPPDSIDDALKEFADLLMNDLKNKGVY